MDYSEVFAFSGKSEVKFALQRSRSKLHYGVTSLLKATSLARQGKLSFGTAQCINYGTALC